MSVVHINKPAGNSVSNYSIIITHVAILLSSRRPVKRMESTAAAKHIRLHLDLPAQIDWQIKSDASLMDQAFGNLVQNAIAYTPEHGAVAMRARRNWQGIVVTVEDTGIGIAEEHLPHIFERYYRVDSARARSSGGFGLGLAIVQTIVRAHGGDIVVESTKGLGTNFTVTLPQDRKSTRLNSSHIPLSRMPSSA